MSYHRFSLSILYKEEKEVTMCLSQDELSSFLIVYSFQIESLPGPGTFTEECIQKMDR